MAALITEETAGLAVQFSAWNPTAVQIEALQKQTFEGLSGTSVGLRGECGAVATVQQRVCVPDSLQVVRSLFCPLQETAN